MNNGVSIICCSYNGRERLQITLEAIKNLECNGNWELIFIDNASTDGTLEFAKEFFLKANPFQSNSCIVIHLVKVMLYG